jgi:hypothetical protein
MRYIGDTVRVEPARLLIGVPVGFEVYARGDVKSELAMVLLIEHGCTASSSE